VESLSEEHIRTRRRMKWEE